LFLLD